MSKVYHLLPEKEAFSEYKGGAISRWVANVLRNDSQGIIVAPGCDSSWSISADRIIELPGLTWYKHLQKKMRHRTPWIIRRYLLRRIFVKLLTIAKPGDVIWIHNRPEFAAALSDAARSAQVLLILHMHNSHLLTANPKIIRHMWLHSVVFVSRYLKEEACKIYPELLDAKVLYNGADDRLFFPMNKECRDVPGPVKVLFASRVVPEKGPAVFSKALSLLLQRDVPVCGLIVGGPEFGSSEPTAFVRDLQETAPANLHFHPYCSGKILANLLRTADIFCLPSIWNDPFPLATLEAMATGLPIVGSRSGGIPEALFDGGGILVERGSVEELAVAIERLVLDPVLRMRLARESLRSFTNHFRWPTVISNYQHIIEGVLLQDVEHMIHA